jgi:hypothetical protein
MTTTSRNRPAGTQIAAALWQLTWTTVIVIGAPIALAHFFGWPLPSTAPDWGQIVTTPLQLVDPVVIVNLFVCLTWICWAIVVAYVALDVIDVARGVGQRLHRIGPFGTVAAKLVGSVVVLVSLARPGVSVATPSQPVPIVQVVAMPVASTLIASTSPTPIRPPSDATSTAPTTPAASPSPIYIVQRNDSLWAIAEAHLGTGFRWTEIYDLNRHRIIDPDLIDAGWPLAMPHDASIAVPVEPSGPVAEAPPAPEPEIAPPPPVAAAAAATTQAAAPTVETPTSAPPDTAGSDPHAIPDAPVIQATPVGPAATSGDELLPRLIAALPGITGATVLATSVLLLLRREQRRRTATATNMRRNPTPLERALVAAADVPLVRWAGQELALLGEQLAGRRPAADPVAVEFSEDYGLELLWDRPFPDAPAPWEAVPGAWAWRLLYDPDAPIPAPERLALIAGLVTFGQRDGRQLMVDLEALGSLSITGDPDAVDRFVRSVVLELGSGDELADAYVVLPPGVVELASTDHLPRLQISEPADARRRIAATAASTSTALAGVGSSSTFAYRLFDTPVLPLEVTVAVIGPEPDDDLSGLADESPPRRAVASLVLGDAPSSAAQLRIEADGTARLEPLGVTFQAAGISAVTESAVAKLLEDLPEPAAVAMVVIEAPDPELSEPPASGVKDVESASAPVLGPLDTVVPADPKVIDITDPQRAVPELSAASAASGWEPPVPRLLVRVLGEPTIVDGPVVGRRELIVVVTMACLDRPTRQEDIQDAIWGGEPVEPRTIWNLVGRARSQLGRWDDDPILSNASRPKHTFTLADGVWTDLQILRELHDQAVLASSAEAMRLLREALTLVEGPPFSADGYEWARINQYAHDAERLIEDSATTLVDLALDAGDVDLARFAVLRGLRGLPGNEILYRARMRIEDTAGNTIAVRAAYTELVTYLGDLESAPSPETTTLYGRLLPTSIR